MIGAALAPITYLLVALSVLAAAVSVSLTLRIRARERNERLQARRLLESAARTLASQPQPESVLGLLADIPLHAVAADETIRRDLMTVLAQPELAGALQADTRRELLALLDRTLAEAAAHPADEKPSARRRPSLRIAEGYARAATAIAGGGLIAAALTPYYSGRDERSLLDLGVLAASEPIVGGALLIAATLLLHWAGRFTALLRGLIIGVALQELIGSASPAAFAILISGLGPGPGAYAGTIASAVALASAVPFRPRPPENITQKRAPLTIALLLIGSLLTTSACFPRIDSATNYSIINFDAPWSDLFFAAEPATAILVGLLSIRPATHLHREASAGLLIGVGIETALLFIGYADTTLAIGPALYLGASGASLIAVGGLFEAYTVLKAPATNIQRVPSPTASL